MTGQHSQQAGLRTRHSVRLIVLAPDQRVLLFDCTDDQLIHDPARAGASEYWNTPGGGIERGESPEAAARRELFEETGMRDARIGPRLWTTERVIQFPDRAVRFRETYLLVRTATSDVSLATLNANERRWVRGYRWWSLDDLRRTTEAVIPRQLAELLEPLLDGATPAEPVRIEI